MRLSKLIRDFNKITRPCFSPIIITKNPQGYSFTIRGWKDHICKKELKGTVSTLEEALKNIRELERTYSEIGKLPIIIEDMEEMGKP